MGNIVLPPANNLPCMRGGHPFARVALRASLFTLHARGVNPITRGTGFGVENTPRMRGGNLAVARCQKVYFYFPRMRGGQPRTPSPFEGDIGFTPHARGSTRSNRVDDTGGTILPACAGVNPRNGYGQFRWNDSPRMRGGQPSHRSLTM